MVCFDLIRKCDAPELIVCIFAQLGDHISVNRCSQVCKLWNKLCQQENIWKTLCDNLWTSKVYIPEKFRALLLAGYAREAFKSSLLDSRRTSISMDEFSSCTFHFRFKLSAGRYWTGRDPFWNGENPICLRFGAGGHIHGYPEIKWFFIDKDGSARDQGGSFIRVATKDLGFPTYMVCRHNNWGFVIQVGALVELPRPNLLSLC